jgi:hypothetical protein
MQRFVRCINSHSYTHALCKERSREYFQCRMDAGLMSVEDLDSMGFDAGKPANASQ